MSMTYRTKRRLQRIGTVALITLMVFLVFWFCWVLWLERYIVYTREDGAVLDMSINANEQVGEVAKPPSSGGTGITIYYNEGDNAIEVTNELAQLEGYYITADMLINDLAGVWEDLEHLSPGTPVMIELKGGYGSFYYSSGLADAITSQSVSVAAVDELIQHLQKEGFYTIARISAFRDYNYGLNHVNIGLPFVGKQYLWADEGGCYWLNPTSQTTLSWISSIVLELRNLGFHEVMLADFRFPASEKYTFNGDKDAALLNAATSLLDSCGNYDFVLSFCVDNASFSLPDSRSRLYLEGVSAANVGVKVAQATITNPEVRLVFLAQTNDTRYSSYGVLRPIDVADVLEAQKAAEKE
jgi:hypothetical protein